MDQQPSKDECMKVQYTSEKFAIEDIARIRKQSNRSRIPLRAYYCDKCNFWHLTSQPDGSSEKIAELEKLVAELEVENKRLKKENEQFRKSEGLTKEEKKAIKVDGRVLELNQKISNLNETIKKLKADNNILITKNIQLNNQVDGKR